MTRPDPRALAEQLLRALAPQDAANDDEPAIDEDAIRARARRDAERMRAVRKR